MLEPRTHRCPICGRYFTTADAMGSHLLRTTRHASAAEYIGTLHFLLAEAERTAEIFREQRDVARDVVLDRAR